MNIVIQHKTTGEILARGFSVADAILRNLRAGKWNLKGADLAGADLRGLKLFIPYQPADYAVVVILADADLRGANLAGATIKHTELTGANLNGANLNGAKLFDVGLERATVRGADLRGAEFDAVSLGTGDDAADFSGADTSGSIIPVGPA